MSTPPTEHVFIVRIQQERGQVAKGTWRGSVEHVPSGQRFYFSSFADLNDYIHLRLNLPGAPTSTTDRLEIP